MVTATQTTVRAAQRAGTSLAVTSRAFRSPRAACVSGLSISDDSTVPPSTSVESTADQREQHAFARSTASARRSVSHDRAALHPDLTHSPTFAARCNIVTSAPPVTGLRKINRQPRRLESPVSPTKQTLATQINRQLSGASSSANHNSPTTNNATSNRQWQILEFTVTHTKQTAAPRSNRHFLQYLNL